MVFDESKIITIRNITYEKELIALGIFLLFLIAVYCFISANFMKEKIVLLKRAKRLIEEGRQNWLRANKGNYVSEQKDIGRGKFATNQIEENVISKEDMNYLLRHK